MDCRGWYKHRDSQEVESNSHRGDKLREVKKERAINREGLHREVTEMVLSQRLKSQKGWIRVE